MQIIFEFSESGAPTGKTIIADSEQGEIKLKDIARRMMLAAMQPGHVCQCQGKCHEVQAA